MILNIKVVNNRVIYQLQNGILLVQFDLRGSDYTVYSEIAYIRLGLNAQWRLAQ